MAPLLLPLTTITAAGTTTTAAITLGGAAAAAGVGLGVAGAIQSSRAAEADAKSRQNLANFDAKVQGQEKIAKRQATKFAQKRQAEEADRRKSTLKTRIAAFGGTGSPVAEDLEAEQASEFELENLLLGFEGEVLATQAGRQGELDIASGKAARRRGKAKKTALRFKAGTTLLTGFA